MLFFTIHLCLILSHGRGRQWRKFSSSIVFRKYHMMQSTNCRKYKKKKFTKKGTERKNRIIEKLHHNEDKVTLVTSLYESVLPLFKEFVMLFQKSTPVIHKVYYLQIELFTEFLSYFMKPHVVAGCTTGKNIFKVCFTSDMFIGQEENIYWC